MNLKALLLILSLTAISAVTFAHPVIDSIGVENQNGKKVILHKVSAKDTYYGIARKYNVKPQAVVQFNNNAALHVGDVVKVPTELPFVTATAQANPPAPANQSGAPAANTAQTGATIQYKVAQHEYLYGIAKRFNTTVEDIKALNNLTSNNLQPGQILNIHQGGSTQTATPQTTAAAPQQQPVAQAPTPAVTQPTPTTDQTGDNSNVTTNPDGSIQYKVTKREYLYSLAKRFNTTVEDIKNTNNLKSSSLRVGQVLTIHQGNAQAVNTATAQQPPVQNPIQQAASSIPDTTKRDTTHINSIADSINVEHKAPSRYGLFEKNEKGVATWMDDPSLDSNKKLILHRTAPVGTVMKITNPMTNRTTFAKVVGTFTDNEQTKDVIIVMTKSVAESLGALDKRFRVNISYGVANE
ncbi:LysM peptidoglycan-binding domain-containing protein [Mucilaginibacter sp. KACC 22063]|uniref:LysM peptidoglycan-binding domain-containing protein n=1 Tax=Mucilaginibacter sp. KACC 22063 TaxID=3025666 RepID=UPI0023654FC8|nr:LysM peptidoglycan-binding domain-containing protein [Mucilaginibacter sp. KACC 22063]WDF53713.1 LysM peptidoglycan-binding domain-containing protein [Mucilaginibacter sp. KACC 22063]